ncbi:ATP-dependent RNA helicase DbpA [Serratia rhizosphaerae]|uniref:ATP-dependent RNA helicase DbpA n=1 Tax=unclassified Serratia (in: enterobacteria) TaxID=2647522 RepID=UPI000CF6B363|nr:MULTISPECIES: ATP-dependent RNA helicase DbpA [unclassified Serratia (in: enterobacteria)]MBU3894247.1 ATP-dependent RNA helicase DbpA [Serratia rubidaea]AVJ18083.1 ATP-dependent RNA helicase DbpA [Serratia sp. MYb239]MCA4822915.1 ATP-dependent RNA helicase DbpA [Serratia rubidaea]QNK34382.1 ATP-dependent RNA helicase DbpA [Serratia sp. JUb9]QPT11721.1 ATP-dependent RNA helicase DbpA [Serratia rubidaea]
MSTVSFSSLSLPAAQLANLNELGYAAMTPVQAAALPAILQGQDVRARAKTGSGKTAAFGIGLLDKINVGQVATQALVLCPTRELADQVSKELRRLARFTQNIKILTLCGGQPMGPQLDSLVHAPHIVVGTPGRVQEHLRKKTLQLDALNVLVLDEADRMLDMGFADDIDDVIAYTPPQRQTLLFSATYPDGIERISARVQRTPLSVEVDDDDAPLTIEQRFYETTRDQRPALLLAAIRHYQPASCVVFCNTKRDCQSVCDALEARDISALALHGDLEQRDRDQVLVRFANRSCRVLVATDVAARGLDIKDLELVVNYEMAFDPEVHVHRVGRTGRAGMSGLAITLCTPQEMARAHALEEYLQLDLKWARVSELSGASNAPLEAEMATLCIDGGRKAKIRPGDILGALTGEAGLTAAEVGKIDMFPMHAYVAIRKNSARKALQRLREGKIKGKNCKARLLK